MSALRGGSDRELALIRTLPRVALNNLRREKDPLVIEKSRGRGLTGKLHGGPQKGSYQRMNYPKLGFEAYTLPWYAKIPREPYYKDHHLRRQYPPISLQQIQLLIDTNRIAASEMIDLTALCNSKVFRIIPEKKEFGFQLTDEGMDNFKAKVNIEVQWTTERVIAAVERNGGTITTAYYDCESLHCARDPVHHFENGRPIPKRMLPPEDAIEYYRKNYY